MDNLANLATEQVNKKSTGIDVSTTREILEIINKEDMLVPEAVNKEIPNIEKAVDAIVKAIKNGGRLFYIGAGTSGRLGILDAVECPPTYGTDPELVQGIIAGGYNAIFKAVECAEDNEDLGKKEILEHGFTSKDVLVGIAASGRTPYVIGALNEAKKLGAVTIGLSNNPNSKISEIVDIAITPFVGAEVVMGSTRMKSGTAQKLVLNMLTTAAMIKLGKVYGNLMVDLKPTNLKLIDRTKRIVSYATGVTNEEAERYLKEADYNTKAAIVMIKTGCNKEKAESLLEESDGLVTRAIEKSNI